LSHLIGLNRRFCDTLSLGIRESALEMNFIRDDACADPEKGSWNEFALPLWGYFLAPHKVRKGVNSWV